jgi:hypothetical protein
MSGKNASPEAIEITPAMIETGAAALVRGMAPARLYAPMTEEDLAKLVFAAMIHARSGNSPLR